MSNHADSTLDWYIDWLKERTSLYARTAARHLEVATGFVTAQQPPQKPAEVEEDEQLAAVDARKAERAEARKGRQYLTGEELMKILATPSEIYRKLN